MRKKAERQLPIDFAGSQKLTKAWRASYRNVREILEANPAVTDLVRADLTRGEKKLKRNTDGVASECILRMAIVQQIEDMAVRGLFRFSSKAQGHNWLHNKNCLGRELF